MVTWSDSRLSGSVHTVELGTLTSLKSVGSVEGEYETTEENEPSNGGTETKSFQSLN